MNIYFKKLKNYFFAGMIAILPLLITFSVLVILFRTFSGLARPLIRQIPMIAQYPGLLDVLSFLGAIFVILFCGMILTNVIGRRIFHLIDSLLQRIPLLSWIYTAVRKITALFYQDGSTANQLRRVVMIQYPRKGVHVIGFLTSDSLSEFNKLAKADLVNVFLPTTPNPTSGFLLMVPRKEVIPLDISVEDAVKIIISGGIASPKDRL